MKRLEANNLSRFHRAQETDYDIALAEIKAGWKQSHWMWYIFPQLRGLGFSEMADYYGIDGLGEAREYLKDDVLRKRLVEISSALLSLHTDDAREVMGSPDYLKLRSCMTLFTLADLGEKVFGQVLDKFYGGEMAPMTLEMAKG